MARGVGVVDVRLVPNDPAVDVPGVAFDRLGDEDGPGAVSYTHLRAHETVLDLVCRLLLEKKKNKKEKRKKKKKNKKRQKKKKNTQARHKTQ